MSKTFFNEVAQQALAELTEPVRFSPQDHQTIVKFKDQLLDLTADLVKGFYDGLFANPVTKSVFREGERPAREKTLADWWQRTVLGPVDEDYWAWQAFVGLIHVKRKVTNAMMLGQVIYVLTFVRQRVPDPELVAALERLLSSVAAVIAQSYDLFFAKSAERIAGVSPELLARQVELGVDDVLREFKR